MNYSYLDQVAKNKGYTREQLAKGINMSYVSLSKRIIGKIEFNIGELRKIKDFLDLTTEEFEIIFLK